MGRLERMAYRMALKKGGLPCPNCSAKFVGGPGDEVWTCPACGYRASRREWSMRNFKQDETTHADPDLPPPDTRIVRKEVTAETIAWEIPPSGKSGGMLAFAILWTGFTCFWTIGAIIATMKEGGASWLFPLFSLPFWAVGLGMLYYGLRSKYAFHLLMIDPKTVVLARSFFNQKSRKSLRRRTLRSAEKKEFYQQNYTPVYGIQIKGDDGKLRFGTTLDEDEKNWLVADLQRVLWPERFVKKERAPLPVKPLATPAPSARPRQLPSFSVDFPPARAKGSLVGLFIGLLVVGSFLAAGIFLMEDAGFFRWLWLGLNSLFALAIISGAANSWRNRNRIVRVRNDRAGIHVETLRGRVPVKTETMVDTSSVQVRSYNSGSSDGTNMLRIELVGENEVLTLLKWYPEDAAREPIARLEEALGQ